MAERKTIEFKGLDEVTKKLRALAVSMGDAAGKALRAEGEIEMTEAKRRVPVDTGALRASGHVEGPSGGTRSLATFDAGTKKGTFGAGSGASDVSVRLVFGGPAADYAVPVHENMEAFHPTGQAKYLESVLLESAPHLAQRVAARIKRTVGM